LLVSLREAGNSARWICLAVFEVQEITEG